MVFFYENPFSDELVPAIFEISILENPYRQIFILSARSEHLCIFLLHIRPYHKIEKSVNLIKSSTGLKKYMYLKKYIFIKNDIFDTKILGNDF